MHWSLYSFCMEAVVCLECSLSMDIFSFKANVGQSVPQCPHSAESFCAWSGVARTKEDRESYNPGIHESLMSSLDHAPRIVWRTRIAEPFQLTHSGYVQPCFSEFLSRLRWYLSKIAIYGARFGVCRMRSCLFKALDRTAWFRATQFGENSYFRWRQPSFEDEHITR